MKSQPINIKLHLHKSININEDHQIRIFCTQYRFIRLKTNQKHIRNHEQQSLKRFLRNQRRTYCLGHPIRILHNIQKTLKRLHLFLHFCCRWIVNRRYRLTNSLVLPNWINCIHNCLVTLCTHLYDNYEIQSEFNLFPKSKHSNLLVLCNATPKTSHFVRPNEHNIITRYSRVQTQQICAARIQLIQFSTIRSKIRRTYLEIVQINRRMDGLWASPKNPCVPHPCARGYYYTLIFICVFVLVYVMCYILYMHNWCVCSLLTTHSHNTQPHT